MREESIIRSATPPMSFARAVRTRSRKRIGAGPVSRHKEVCTSQLVVWTKIGGTATDPSPYRRKGSFCFLGGR